MNKDKYKRINLTFSSDNIEEMELYDYIEKQSKLLGKAKYIKQLILKDMKARKWAFIFLYNFCSNFVQLLNKCSIVYIKVMRKEVEMRIIISFKNTKRDIKIYNYFNGLENGEKSEKIKNILEQYMEGDNKWFCYMC